MTAHQISLRQAGDDVLPDPDPATIYFEIGDTLSFTAEGGSPSVTFAHGHGFSGSHFKAGDQPLKVERHAKFTFHCQIVLPDGKTIGWASDRQGKSGGDGQT